MPKKHIKKDETVILLHGMARSRASMWILERRLRQIGYQTLNFPYSSASSSLQEISDNLLVYISNYVKTPRYHLVAHSLGNIIIRHAFKKEYPPGLGRIVMLAPPNHPARLAKIFRRNWIYRCIFGDSGQKLADREFYQALPPPSVEFGVIASEKGHSVLFSEPNDGIVTTRSTKLEGMADWVLVHRVHTFIMNAQETFEQVVHFLEHGAFVHCNEESAKQEL